MAYYNVTNFTEANSTVEGIRELSRLAGGDLFGAIFLIMLYFLVLMGLKEAYSFKPALLAAGFVTMVAALLLVPTRLVSVAYVWAAVVIFGLTVFFSFISRGQFGE